MSMSNGSRKWTVRVVYQNGNSILRVRDTREQARQVVRTERSRGRQAELVGS